MRFSENFLKFMAQLFQNTFIRSSMMEFSRVLGCRLSSSLILKNESTREIFLKFLEVKLSPQKILWLNPISVATCNICKNRLVHRRCPSGFCKKYHVQSMKLWSSILVKKTLSLELLWAESEKRSLITSRISCLASMLYELGEFK